jgi:ABC-type multidrug transport system fused ATPase/permease subunit
LILMMEQGRIVEKGRHNELLAANGRYADLYRSQFSAPLVAANL